MSKKTDYKRLWRNATKQVIEITKERDKYKSLYEGLMDIIEGIKSGEITVKQLEEIDKNDKHQSSRET